ncbi:hypothetical protein DM01DRAFT_1333025 [Hesseltinella vesiculosa]|uniref:PPM-type phosphatase domain-containing protein n=1 Tax=Hesseltinella vesiculosa TaxID=101127 RepID=A0A1X2GSJ0_9FUNG|nr:hypothetical protein DM01DRAFT_1333025 [Hesseltinella vesiculosa]
MESVDTELGQLNLCDQLRSNSSFMKLMATLFHYGNQPMGAAQLVIAVRALELLPLRGETPKSTIQGIISTSRKMARDLQKPDPFAIHKDASGRGAKYAIAEDVLNGATVPPMKEIPDEPIILKSVQHPAGFNSLKRQKKPQRLGKFKKKRNAYGESDDDDNDEIDIDAEDDDYYGLTSRRSNKAPIHEEDTIFNYSLLFSPPPNDDSYIDPIDFVKYPVASYFAIVQQKGYAYPRFRSQERVKIPKVKCEDKYRVTDVLDRAAKQVVGRMFILADGHGGPGCAEYFVKHTPMALQDLCNQFHPDQFDDPAVQQQFEKQAKQLVETLDQHYLEIKREQLGRVPSSAPPTPPAKPTATTPPASSPTTAESPEQNTSDSLDDSHLDNDGCTLIINLFFGRWLVNINVGDSRSILISAPEPDRLPAPATAFPSSSSAATPNTPTNGSGTNGNGMDTLVGGVDKNYLMDVAFASQDHKPYLEHLAREILENGGEFIDSVQNRVIKVELSSLKEDGNRQAKRYALKNARIRPSSQYLVQQHLIQQQQQREAAAATAASNGYLSQSAVRSTATDPPQPLHDTPASSHAPSSTPASASSSPPPPPLRPMSFTRRSHLPSLNVARSCGDLDFKMNGQKHIISCEPDVTFMPIADDLPTAANDAQLADLSTVTAAATSTAHKSRRRHFLLMSTDGTFDYMYEETPDRQNRAIAKMLGPMIEDGEKLAKYLMEQEANVQTIAHQPGSPMDVDRPSDDKPTPNKETDDGQSPSKTPSSPAVSPTTTDPATDTGNDDGANNENAQDPIPDPPKPRLVRPLSDQENKVREAKEKTLSYAARYFADREANNGFFSSTLQDYDDCTIILVEI